MSTTVHIPVMMREVLDSLNIQPSDRCMDGTFGGGGHAMAMLEMLDPEKGGALLCVDRDLTALDRARQDIEKYQHAGKIIKIYHGSFSDVDTSSGIHDFSPTKILLDLGWSMDQFSLAERGFSFQVEGPLDMRLSREEDVDTAWDILNTLSESELADVIFTFGEETRSRSIAAAIKKALHQKRLHTTIDLSQIIESVVPKRGPTHPATKTFQALRIAVNHEIGVITEGLPKLIELLPSGGRLCVITFHSIEDRIVKRIFESEKREGRVQLVNKHVIIPSQRELEVNPRSRSAKIRCVEKI